MILVLAGTIGFVLGLLGGGGSMLAVPTFIYFLEIDPKEAVAITLPIVGVTSFVAALGYWRRGLVDGRSTLMFGAIAMCGAYGGARLAALVSGTSQVVLLTVVMAAAAVSMLRGGANIGGEAPATAGGRPGPLALLIATAIGVGLITGLVGIGGGFLFVPALVLLAGIPMRRAIGTSLLVIAMNAAAAFAGYAGHSPIPWDVVALSTAVASAGALGGLYAAQFVPQCRLQRMFGVFLLVMAALMALELHQGSKGWAEGNPPTRADPRSGSDK